MGMRSYTIPEGDSFEEHYCGRCGQPHSAPFRSMECQCCEHCEAQTSYDCTCYCEGCGKLHAHCVCEPEDDG